MNIALKQFIKHLAASVGDACDAPFEIAKVTVPTNEIDLVKGMQHANCFWQWNWRTQELMILIHLMCQM